MCVIYIYMKIMRCRTERSRKRRVLVREGRLMVGRRVEVEQVGERRRE